MLYNILKMSFKNISQERLKNIFKTPQKMFLKRLIMFWNILKMFCVNWDIRTKFLKLISE